MWALAPQRGHCICCEKPLVHSELGAETFEKAVARNIRFGHAMVFSNPLAAPRGKAKGTAKPYHQGPARQLFSAVVINCYMGRTKNYNNNNS